MVSLYCFCSSLHIFKNESFGSDVCLSVRTCVEINFHGLLGMDDTLRPPACPSMEDLPLTPPDWVMTPESLIKKEAKRLNSANQQVNNLFTPYPPTPAFNLGVNWAACYPKSQIFYCHQITVISWSQNIFTACVLCIMESQHCTWVFPYLIILLYYNSEKYCTSSPYVPLYLLLTFRINAWSYFS